MEMMKEVEGLRLEEGRLMETVCHRGEEVVRPLIHRMPQSFELTGGVQGDMRVNIIGLPVILHFKLCICE